LSNNCETIDLGITQQRDVSFTISEKSAGKKEADVIVRNADVSKRFTLKYEVLDEPLVSVESLKYLPMRHTMMISHKLSA